MSQVLHSGIYLGEVMHQRLRPVKHRFVYRVSAWLIDLDELETLNQFTCVSIDRFNLFSFHQRDHGDGSGTPLKTQIKALLQQHNIDTGSGAVRLLCYPRLFGYVFNPLSVFYCYNKSGDLSAILYEVSNTFGQRHSYLIPVDPLNAEVIRQQADKAFYVSPFMPMQTAYQFRLQPPDTNLAVMIRQTDDQGPLFDATFSGKRIEITQRSILKTFIRHPLMTLKVIGGIHWEALRLWRKGMKVQPRPMQPAYRVSLVSPQGVKLS
jgi:DUF1365 family protein